ncbi:MAG: hypothetical protein IPM39_06210 [Chloroflexi bacterium]|nr:hypothetical protein [Chloroflexota bacterium]
MAEPGETLSERERAVLQSVVNGASNKEVAVELAISQNTVKVHLRNIYTKLGVSSRTEATTAALQQGLVTIPGMEATDPTVSPLPEPEPIAETLTEETAVLPTPTVSTRRLTGSTAVVVGGLLVALLAILVLLSRLAFSPAPTPTPTVEPFLSEPIGQTRWMTARPLTMPLADMASVAVGLDLYQIGGETAVGVTNRVLRLNTIQHVWQEMAAKPTAVADATAAVLFGEIYVPGGRLADGSPTNIVEAYSPANNAWRPVASLPRPVTGGLALTDGSFLYLFGGSDGRVVLDTAYIYDQSSDSWRPLPPLPEAKTALAGGQVTGKLVVVGGSDGTSALDTCHLFDTSSARWQACPAMLSPRAGAGAAVLFNKLYLIGGLNGNELVTFSEFYDPTMETWQVLNTPMLENNPSWADMGVANVETRIYVLGGRRAGELQSDNYFYTPVIYQTFIPATTSDGEGRNQPEP